MLCPSVDLDIVNYIVLDVELGWLIVLLTWISEGFFFVRILESDTLNIGAIRSRFLLFHTRKLKLVLRKNERFIVTIAGTMHYVWLNAGLELQNLKAGEPLDSNVFPKVEPSSEFKA